MLSGSIMQNTLARLHWRRSLVQQYGWQPWVANHRHLQAQWVAAGSHADCHVLLRGMLALREWLEQIQVDTFSSQSSSCIGVFERATALGVIGAIEIDVDRAWLCL